MTDIETYTLTKADLERVAQAIDAGVREGLQRGRAQRDQEVAQATADALFAWYRDHGMFVGGAKLTTVIHDEKGRITATIEEPAIVVHEKAS